MNFSLFKSRKRGVLTAVADVVSGTGTRADVARGCDAALRPRGKAMGGQREAQVAHRAQTRGRRPRVSTWVHADACEGRHVAGKVSNWRAHEYSGPWLGSGVVTQMRYGTPLFKLTRHYISFRVGLCPTHFLPFASDVATSRASILIALRRSRGPESSNHHIKHVRYISVIMEELEYSPQNELNRYLGERWARCEGVMGNLSLYVAREPPSTNLATVLAFLQNCLDSFLDFTP